MKKRVMKKGGVFKTSSGDKFSRTAPKTKNFAKHLQRKALGKAF